MKRKMNHRERMQACLSGEQPDRIPVSLWRHFPVDDQTPDSLAAATAAFQHTYDFDFIKVTPSSSFCLRDWGIEDHWTGSTEGTRDYGKRVITRPEDWERLPVLEPESGSLCRQLTCLESLIKEFSPDTPIIQTLFSPMAQAKNLAGKETLLIHLRQYPDAVLAGLEIITKSTLRFLEAATKTGIDGIFFAIQHAQYALLSTDEFVTFEKKFDLEILEQAKQLWLNIGHLHGENIMFEQVADFPLHVLNWHDRHTSPSLSQGQKQFKGVVCGGLRRIETMVLGTPLDVQDEVEEAIHSTEGKRLIIGTGCVLPITAPHGNILAAAHSTEIISRE